MEGHADNFDLVRSTGPGSVRGFGHVHESGREADSYTCKTAGHFGCDFQDRGDLSGPDQAGDQAMPVVLDVPGGSTSRADSSGCTETWRVLAANKHLGRREIGQTG